MEAIVQRRFGAPADVLVRSEVEKPIATGAQVLVRVRAMSIHAGDCHVMRGVPYIMRPAFGWRGPRNAIPGTDLAGTVEAVGDGVTGLQVGDDVFGWGTQVCAEYAAVAEKNLLAKPVNLSFEQAAAVGVSAQTALQAIRDHAKVQSGQKVLITGASGGVGTFAVQIAKSFGAEVTAVCSSGGFDVVRSIGADHVIDYAEENFTLGLERYDHIIDIVGNHSFAEVRRALAPGGFALPVGGHVGGWFGGVDHVLVAFLQSLYVRQQRRPFVSLNKPEVLRALKDMAETGTVKPVIDKIHEMNDAAAAFGHVAEGHGKGKTVISI